MISLKFLSKIEDTRVDCWSILVEISVNDYINLVDGAYTNRGGIRFQRDALKTTSARRIRSRLVDDLMRGAVIPPLVIGIVVAESTWENVRNIDTPESLSAMLSEYSEELSIIDGMQRTTALKEALKSDAAVGEHTIRVEAWIALTAESLIYRMLVLNTGQVPWNLKQQLEVVYSPLVKTIGNKVAFTRLLTGAERRWKGGEFKSDSLIEMYIAFGLRRTEIDTQESLADEFSRLDVADALTKKKYDHYFYYIVQMLVDFDIAVSRFNEVADPRTADPQDGEDGSETLIRRRSLVRGRNIFDTQAARVGFVVACAIIVLGRIGMDKDETSSDRIINELKDCCSKLVRRLSAMSAADLQSFLALDILAEKLSGRPSSAVGRWERAFFERSFRVLCEESFAVPSLEPCWRA